MTLTAAQHDTNNRTAWY